MKVAEPSGSHRAVVRRGVDVSEPDVRPAGRPLLVKLGGRALEGEPAAFARELLALGTPAVVAHGGGAEVTAWCERLGIAPAFERGRRVTDEPTLEVVAAVLAGLANKRLVAAFRAAGLDAVGLSVVDGGLVTAELHPDRTLGAVGQVNAVDVSLLETLLAHGRWPVIASLGAVEGRLLNLNADDVAAALAGALRSPALLLLSDAPGLQIGGRTVERLDPPWLERVLRHPDVHGGMLPKLEAARTAMELGVPRVAIARWSRPGDLRALLAGEGEATFIAESAGEAVFAVRDAAPATAGASGAEVSG